MAADREQRARAEVQRADAVRARVATHDEGPAVERQVAAVHLELCARLVRSEAHGGARADRHLAEVLRGAAGRPRAGAGREVEERPERATADRAVALEIPAQRDGRA